MLALPTTQVRRLYSCSRGAASQWSLLAICSQQFSYDVANFLISRHITFYRTALKCQMQFNSNTLVIPTISTDNSRRSTTYEARLERMALSEPKNAPGFQEVRIAQAESWIEDIFWYSMQLIVNVCACLCICAAMYVCMHVWMCVCVCVCIHVCTYVFMYLCMYIHMLSGISLSNNTTPLLPQQP